MSNRVLEYYTAYPKRRENLIKHETEDSNSSAMWFVRGNRISTISTNDIIVRQFIIYTPAWLLNEK